jgi:hypothetical protein
VWCGLVLCRGGVPCDVVHAVEECGGAVQWCGAVEQCMCSA